MAAMISKQNTVYNNCTTPTCGTLCNNNRHVSICCIHNEAKLRKNDSTVYHDNNINKSNVSGATMADINKNLNNRYPPIRSRLAVLVAVRGWVLAVPAAVVGWWLVVALFG